MSQLEVYLLRSAGMHKTASGIQPSQALPMPKINTLSPDPEQSEDSVKSKADPLTELSMWRTWKDSNYKPKHLRPLQESIQPIIKYHKNRWRAANVPDDLLEMHATHLAIDALKTYNPNIKGSGGRTRALGSHIHGQMKRMQRFVVENQNAGRIQESRAGKNIRIFNEARGLLFTELNRDPTAQELAERMGIMMGKAVTVKETKMYLRESRKDRNVSDENFSYTPTDTRILIKLLPEELTPLENQVFERYYGVNGSPKMKPGQIAKQLRLSNARVSRVLNKISEKANEYM